VVIAECVSSGIQVKKVYCSSGLLSPRAIQESHHKFRSCNVLSAELVMRVVQRRAKEQDAVIILPGSQRTRHLYRIVRDRPDGKVGRAVHPVTASIGLSYASLANW